MGNCLLGGMSDPEAVIKVITTNGGIMEFYAPITVSFIINEFPGHGIFPSHDLLVKPLNQFEELVAGQSYYLLPLSNQPEHPSTSTGGGDNRIVRQGHARSHSVPTIPYPVPYRMSLDYQRHYGSGLLKKTTSTEPFSCRTSRSSKSKNSSSSTSSRFWKVKLVITPKQLMDILSQEALTKELIESVRIVAKCGVAKGGYSPASASAAASIVSDQWSLSSSGRSASDSSKIDALVVDI
ncbi:hypothetical protein RJT34_26409 [Clitoria ternatea]|uniref:Uncharacterized protein n=1 Tax=Clitoria ternatea TaxID=43366 RepID=A0AAN9F6T8_CLITE